MYKSAGSGANGTPDRFHPLLDRDQEEARRQRQSWVELCRHHTCTSEGAL